MFWKQFKRKSKKTNKSRDDLTSLVAQGEEFFYQGREKKACKVWLKAWDIFRARLKPEHATFEKAEKWFSSEHNLLNWSGEIHQAVTNTVIEDPEFLNPALEFHEQFLEQFSSEPLNRVNYLQSQAELTLRKGESKKAQELYEKMVEEFPRNPWAHIFYAHELCHFSPEAPHYLPFDKEKARDHLTKALELAENEHDRQGAQERLDELDRAVAQQS